MLSVVDQTVLDFITRLKSSESTEESGVQLDREAKRLGFQFVAYHMVKVPGLGDKLNFGISTYPEPWRNRYIEQAYTHIDPIIQAGPLRWAPFDWGEMTASKTFDKKTKRFFWEAESFGIHHGLTVPIHGPSGAYASMTFATDESAKSSRDIIRGSGNVAHLLALHFHDLVGRPLTDEVVQSQVLPLSKRERECLLWVARGKGNWDISVLLKVSERTVTFHIENAKQKLGVFNRSHAVVKAIMLGFIDP